MPPLMVMMWCIGAVNDVLQQALFSMTIITGGGSNNNYDPVDLKVQNSEIC